MINRQDNPGAPPDRGPVRDSPRFGPGADRDAIAIEPRRPALAGPLPDHPLEPGRRGRRPRRPQAREALASLCQAYWYPLYAYIRRRGHDPDAARDLTQDFFVRAIEKGLLAEADPNRGRFRSFLRTVCVHYLANRRDRDQALKRGGGRPTPSIDADDAEGRYALEPTHDLTPDRIFDRVWALTLLDRVLDQLRREYDDAGRSSTFEELRGVLTDGPTPPPTPRSPGDSGRPKGRSGSPSTASDAATGPSSARRSPPPSTTRARSTTRSMTSSKPWRPQGQRELWNVYASWEIARIRLETKAFSRETEPLITLEWRLPLSFRQQLIQKCLHRLVEFLIADILEADHAVRVENIDSREGLHAPLRGNRAL